MADTRAWTRASLSWQDVRIPVPDACQAEIEAAIGTLTSRTEPALPLDPGAFPLPACRQLMANVRSTLLDGVGHVILDRIAVERHSPDQNRAIAWLLARLLPA